MRMTIDEAILYMELYKLKLTDSVSDLAKDIEAYDVVINTAKRYQKMEKVILDSCDDMELWVDACEELKDILNGSN